MPQFYKRKTSRCYRSIPEVLQKAAEEYKKKGSLRKAAEMFDIDKMTLQRYIEKSKNASNVEMGYKAVSLCHYIFTPEMEEDLAAHVISLANQYHGLSLPKCKELSNKFAAANNLNMPETWQKNKTASKAWWVGFKQR